MMTKLAAIMTGMTLVLAACKPAATAPAHDIPAAMRQTAATLLQSPLLHATSIAVVYRGKEFILHQGELETGKANPPNDTTLYEIGSVSKTFAGLLLANAVLDGKAALDDPIQQYLAAAYPNLQSQGQPVRLRHLITHTSNMPGMLPLQVNTILKDFPAHATPAKLNAAYANYGQQQFWQDLHTVSIKGPLGKDYAYSSAGTELIAHTLEKIYGLPYDVLLTQFIAREAGMHDTRLSITASDAGRLAPGYHSDNPVRTTPMPQLPWGAAGNLKSTMPDMAKYLRLQLSANPAVIESHKPLVRFQDDFSIGYFWNIGANRQLGTHYVHHGGVPAAQSYAYVIPRYQLGVFIITNQSGDATAAAMEKALAHIFDAAEAMESANQARSF
ncbi:serine hydrolase domain-containing protein [Janthinobacterium sp. Mn2066]|uniref:serine hydrolase domain-containing protein n=1 Tax=Janthinobacterium sp. Mn2066 TaxID=3395264 RepID=UPI003BD24077